MIFYNILCSPIKKYLFDRLHLPVQFSTFLGSVSSVDEKKMVELKVIYLILGWIYKPWRRECVDLTIFVVQSHS